MSHKRPYRVQHDGLLDYRDDLRPICFALDRSQELYDRFQSLFPDPPAGGSGLRNRTFYTPGNHDVTLSPPSTWKDPAWWKLYWTLQTREFSRWKFKHLFGTTVQDLGWKAEVLYPPSGGLSHHLVPPEPQPSSSGKYITKLDHTYRKSLHARVPLQVAHPDGSAPTKVAELILLDTTDVIALQRMGRDPFAPGNPPDGEPGREADWRYGGAWWFLDSLAKEEDKGVPRILFTHVPLWREAEDSCSLPEELMAGKRSNSTDLPPGISYAPSPSVHRLRNSREKIVPGSDEAGTYENLVGPQWSRFILEKARPSVIFTGDDHDVCHNLHGKSQSSTAHQWSTPELTVPAMSLTSGVSRPGYARLAIWPQPPPVGGTAQQTRIEYAACDLPDQVHTWAISYPVLVLTAFIGLLVRRRWVAKYERIRPEATSSFLTNVRYRDARQTSAAGDDEDNLFFDEEDELASSSRGGEALPMTERRNSHHSRSSSFKKTDGDEALPSSSDGVQYEFDYDVERLGAVRMSPSSSISPLPSSSGAAPNGTSRTYRDRDRDRDDEKSSGRRNRGGWRDLGHLAGGPRPPKRRATRRSSDELRDEEDRQRSAQEYERRRLLRQFCSLAWPVVAFWLLLFVSSL